jgi:hypothetical protein
MSDNVNDTFRENVIQQCRRCVVSDECEIDKSLGYCPLEEEIYDRFMNALEEEYDNVTEVVKLIAEQLIMNMIFANRVARHIKLKGLTQKVKITTPDGMEKEYDQENILKQGLHLDINRVIRLFKEMKLTPKEKSPTKKQLDIRQVIMNVNKPISRVESVPNEKRGRKAVLQSL